MSDQRLATTSARRTATAPGRRQLMQGAAWAMPTLAFTAAAPAFAASGCIPSLGFSGGANWGFGTLDVGTTDQWLDAGGQTNIVNLPPGVKVTSISYQFWIENRVDQKSNGPGFFWAGNATSDKKGYCTASGCTIPFTPTAGSGFASTVTNTKNLTTVTYPDGVSLQSWDLNFSWSAARDTNIASRYTANGVCQNFTTGPSARLRINYLGVPAMTTPDKAAGKETVHSMVTISATLSNGQVLSKTLLAH